MCCKNVNRKGIDEMVESKMKVTTVPFAKLPEHDTCWSFIEGVDNRLYTGVCGEITGGMSTFVTAYEPVSGKLDYLCDVSNTLGIDPGNGEATHSKVHYCLLQGSDGTIYASTHCTGAPVNDWIWRAWNCWKHPQKFFRGSGIVIMDPDGTVKHHQVFLPHEGSRCMALAEKHRRIYGISYPRNRFFIYDIDTHETRMIGRIGNVNPQCIWLDVDENAYTTDDYGRILKFDAETEKLDYIGATLPCAEFRNGYHNTVYDVTPSPDRKGVYGVTWSWGSRLFYFDFETHEIRDYGKAYGEESAEWKHIINDHVGGMAFGSDMNLYFVANLEMEDGAHPNLVRMNPKSGERELLGALYCDGHYCDHISRGAFGNDGKLYFAEAGNTPTKLFCCDVGLKPGPHGVRRVWG